MVNVQSATEAVRIVLGVLELWMQFQVKPQNVTNVTELDNAKLAEEQVIDKPRLWIYLCWLCYIKNEFFNSKTTF